MKYDDSVAVGSLFRIISNLCADRFKDQDEYECMLDNIQAVAAVGLILLGDEGE